MVKKSKHKRNKRKKIKADEEAKESNNADKTYVEWMEDIKTSKKFKESMNYLVLWRDVPDQWKFKKHIQKWLIQNMYNPDIVLPHYFKIMKKYLKPLKGGLREKLRTEAIKLLENKEKLKLTKMQNKIEDEETRQKHITKKLKRAALIAKLFS